jgi:hypothetical protein
VWADNAATKYAVTSLLMLMDIAMSANQLDIRIIDHHPQREGTTMSGSMIYAQHIYAHIHYVRIANQRA